MGLFPVKASTKLDYSVKSAGGNASTAKFKGQSGREVYLAGIVDSIVMVDGTVTVEGKVKVTNLPQPYLKWGMCYGKVHHPSVQSALKNLILNGTPVQKAGAATKLGVMGNKCNLWTVSLLLPLLKKRDSKTKAAAAKALGKIRGKGAVEVAALLKDRDSKVRIAAATAMPGFKYDYAKSAGALANAVRVSKTKAERHAMVNALYYVAINSAQGTMRAEVGKSRGAMLAISRAGLKIAATLKDGNDVTKKTAFSLLVAIRAKKRISALTKALGHKSAKVRTKVYGTLKTVGKPALPYLRQALKGADSRTKKEIIRLIREITTPKGSRRSGSARGGGGASAMDAAGGRGGGGGSAR